MFCHRTPASLQRICGQNEPHCACGYVIVKQVRAVSHWHLFHFCQAYTRTIQKNGEFHWSCMVANERLDNQFFQQKLVRFSKQNLPCLLQAVRWLARPEKKHMNTRTPSSCGLKRQCSIKRLYMVSCNFDKTFYIPIMILVKFTSRAGRLKHAAFF